MMNNRIENINRLAGKIGRSVKLMEVCGTHTMAAFRTGLRSLLPPNVSLISGPGCPVCVTDNSYIDQALAIAKEPNTAVVTFGDMLRVPGSETSLEKMHALGADVRVVYSPLDALDFAKADSTKRIVFLGVGFETTSPGVAWTIKEAYLKGITNYCVLCAHKLVPSAMSALLENRDIKIDGFMCPGHVSVIIGAKSYDFIPDKYHIPCVVAGFEGPDMVNAIENILIQICDKRAETTNQYKRSVTLSGNKTALSLIKDVFEECNANWRGIGLIPKSGLKIRNKFKAHDASEIFKHVPVRKSVEPKGCICGLILKGIKIPTECLLFRNKCTPDNPVGSCMVSSEGTCAAYYKYSKPK